MPVSCRRAAEHGGQHIGHRLGRGTGGTDGAPGDVPVGADEDRAVGADTVGGLEAAARVGEPAIRSARHAVGVKRNAQRLGASVRRGAPCVPGVAVEMLHVGRDKVYYLLRAGQLRSITIGKLRRITGQHLAAFIASREDVADVS